MAVVIERISLMTDGFGRPLDWNDIIGLTLSRGPIERVNIEIEASGVKASFPIEIEVTSRLPNGAGGTPTIVMPVRWSLLPTSLIGGLDDRALFQLSKPIVEAGPFLGSKGNLDVATIVRDGGTSDDHFRAAVKATSRGTSTQPTKVGASTDNEASGIPDALALLQAAGVEVLEVAVVPSPTLTLSARQTSRLIRHPARVVYYSGHGLSSDNCLAIEVSPHRYACVTKPVDLTSTWKLPACLNLSVFIIAGCSVLNVDTTTTPPAGIGLDWAPLLASKGGPLAALLGYGKRAPLDDPVGNTIADEMGAQIRAVRRILSRIGSRLTGRKRPGMPWGWTTGATGGLNRVPARGG